MCCVCCVQLFATPWIVAHQAPLSMKFSRKEYWSGLPFLTPRDLPHPGIKLTSLVSRALTGRVFTTVPGENEGYHRAVNCLMSIEGVPRHPHTATLPRLILAL